MSVRPILSSSVPNRPPTWLEIIIGVLVAASVVPELRSPSSISWPAVGLGFLAFAVALGPASNTSLGNRIGRWFRDIGIAGRSVVIASFVIAVVVTSRLETIPNALLGDAAIGGLLAVFCYLFTHLALYREVSGLMIAQNRDE